MASHTLRGLITLSLTGSAVLWIACGPVRAQQYDQLQPSSPIREITAASDRLEMTVNTSRILTLSRNLTEANKIPQVQVNNDAILRAVPLSPTQVQVFAQRTGVTTVNVWDETGKIYSVDVIVYADARELTLLLQSLFPNASLRITPVGQNVLITGYVDHTEDATKVIEIAHEYYPKVLDNIQVGGVHQVLLHVKAMEVSRTKLRELGFDWSLISGNDSIASGVSGLIDPITGAATSGATLTFDIVNGADDFFGVLRALRQDNLAKLLAEPTLVTVSGRPAFFQVGGEVPVLVPQGLGTVGVEYKKFGTQVDFVPIVLGNGRIRLEVRPRVSDIDNGRSITTPDGQTVYAFSTREVDTGVELQAGQTLAIAGLVQNRVEAERVGLPWVSELPYVGNAFGRVRHLNNEVELLIFVTPELVDPMDAGEVPPCGPGMRTADPSDWELYGRRYIEVPRCCPPGSPGTMVVPPGRAPGSEGILSPDSLTEPPQPAPTDAPSPPALRSTAAGGTTAAGVSRRRTSSSRREVQSAAQRSTGSADLPGLMGPIGYDAKQ